MRTPLAVSFVAAALCHALVLFGVRLATPARPLVASDAEGSVDVDLVAGMSGGTDEGGADSQPGAAPEPTPQPEPAPTPQPVPAPELDEAALPSSTPPSEPILPAPQPEKPILKSTPSAPRSRLVMATKTNVHASEKHGTGLSQRGSRASGKNPGGGAGGTNGNGSGGATGTTASPHYRSNPKPEYPTEARRNHQQGMVIVRVDVGPSGRPKSVSLAKSSGFPLLDQAATEAVRRWTFDPGTVAGVPVDSSVEVPVRFNFSL